MSINYAPHLIARMQRQRLQKIVDTEENFTEETVRLAEAELDRRDRDASDPAAIAQREQEQIESEGINALEAYWS